jgi:hypothetical protein
MLNTQELTVLVIPEWEKDFIIDTARFRDSLPKELRKHLLGPIVSRGGQRTFVFLPAGGTEDYRIQFIEHGKANPKAQVCNLQFGNGHSSVEELAANIKSLEAERELLQMQLKNCQEERDEAIKMTSKDEVLAEAVKDLKTIKARLKGT